MPPEVLEARLSLIWTQTILDLLGDPAPATARLSALGRRGTYETLFKQVLDSQVSTAPVHALMGATKPVPVLGPPWPKPTGQLFWGRYLESSALNNLSGSAAWHGLVPLRVKFPCLVEPGDWLAKVPRPVEVKVLPEAFFYPHGCAFVVTVIVLVKQAAPADPGLALFDAVDLAGKIRRDKFNVTWENSAGWFSEVQWPGGSNSMKLQDLAERALAAIRSTAFDPGSAAGDAPVIDPFTIFTVVRGRGVDPAQPVQDDARRALEAVTSWSQSWLNNPLQELKDRQIEIKTSPSSHVLWGRPKARAVWFPERFTHPDNPPSLACYHRNLTFTSLQVESLCGLAAKMATLLNNPQSNSQNLLDCARMAGGALGRLYGGGGVYKKSYRSMSPRVQIVQNNFVADINKVRNELNVGGDLA